MFLLSNILSSIQPHPNSYHLIQDLGATVNSLTLVPVFYYTNPSNHSYILSLWCLYLSFNLTFLPIKKNIIFVMWISPLDATITNTESTIKRRPIKKGEKKTKQIIGLRIQSRCKLQSCKATVVDKKIWNISSHMLPMHFALLQDILMMEGETIKLSTIALTFSSVSLNKVLTWKKHNLMIWNHLLT